MSSSQRTVDDIVDRIANAGAVSARKMFGEYAIYCDGKVVALVCDDTLFVKPTTAGKDFAGDVELAPAYKGAKPSLLIPADQWDDGDWLSTLIKLTAAELPPPKPKTASPKRAGAKPK